MRMGPGVYILQAQAPAPAPAHSLAPSPLNIEKRPQRPRRPSRKDTWEGNSSEGEGEGEGRSANFEPVYGDQGQVLAYKLSRQNMSSSESRRGLRTTRPRLDTRSSDVALPVGSVERPRPVGVIYPPLPPSYPSPPPPSYPSPPPSPPATLPSMFPSEYGYGYGYGIEHGDTANRSLSSHSSIDSLFLYDGKGKGNIHPSSSTSFFVTNFGQGQALAKDLDWESGASDSESGSERGYAPSVTSWDSDSDRSLFLYDGKGKAKVGNNRPGSSSSFFTSEFAMSRVELLAGDRDAQSECMSRSDMSDWEWRQHVPRSPSSVGMPSHSHWEQEADGEEEAEQRIKLCESPAAMSYEPERAQEQGYLLPLELLSPILESGNSFPLADARNELPSQILQGQFRSVDGHVGGVYPQEGTGIAGSWEEAGRGLRMEELPTHTRILSKKKGSTHLK
ncbi:hypothetical protein F4808DRAFT_173428 [Astrocystis sublimbata]|nr:hypothetical protein F4808DRAFT_173428 [Astrocystis sublimbata]